MYLIKEFKRHRIDIRTLVLLQLFIIVVVYLLYGVRTTPDSGSTVRSLEIMYSGSDGSLEVGPFPEEHRLLRPLALWLAYPFLFLGGYNALALESAIFQILIIPVFYLFSYKLVERRDIAFFSVLYFILSPVTLNNTLVVMVDIQTWFLYLITIFFAFSEFRKEIVNETILFCLSFTSGLSFLMKEIAISAIIYINLMVLTTNKVRSNFLSRSRLVFLLTLTALVPIFLNNYLVIHFYGHGYYEWYIFANENYIEPEGLLKFIISFKNGIGFLLPFVFYGTIKQKQFQLNEMLILFLSSMFIFFITIHRARFLFMAFPILVPLSLYGLWFLVNKDFKFVDKSANRAFISLFGVILAFNHLIFRDNYEWLSNFINN